MTRNTKPNFLLSEALYCCGHCRAFTLYIMDGSYPATASVCCPFRVLALAALCVQDCSDTLRKRRRGPRRVVEKARSPEERMAAPLMPWLAPSLQEMLRCAVWRVCFFVDSLGGARDRGVGGGGDDVFLFDVVAVLRARSVH